LAARAAGAPEQPIPVEPASPPWWLLVLEGRAVFEWGAWWLSRPWFQHAPRGKTHPVLVLPGLIAGDPSTWPLRRFLGALGYPAMPWEEGINRGPQPGLQERLLARIEALADAHGEQVSLIGWSLGGLMARALAWQRTDLVRMVIALGSPLSAVPRQTNAAAVFRLASGLDPEDPALHALLGGHPPVPLTSILSRSDGVVHWRASLAPEGDRCESIEVPASHLGLGVNPLALYAIADRLAQNPQAWRPFEHSGWRRLLFRNPQLDRWLGD
jgi:pimeloyl-ACP methyl ester carboxylesterase